MNLCRKSADTIRHYPPTSQHNAVTPEAACRRPTNILMGLIVEKMYILRKAYSAEREADEIRGSSVSVETEGGEICAMLMNVPSRRG